MAGKKVAISTAEDNFDKIPPLDEVEGSAFGYMDTLFYGYDDGKVFDYGDWAARDIKQMLDRDYKAIQIEQVISHPILAAKHSNKAADGDKGELKWLNDFWDSGFCRETLDDVIGHMTSAFSYKRSFIEKEWSRTPDGKVGYKSLGFRPQTTCRLMRNVHNGQVVGFQQIPYYLGGDIGKGGMEPIEIPAKRAFVFTHGQRLDQINGISDLAVTYWAWKTKTKIMFLWFQYLEGYSLPRTLVEANDYGTAVQIARQVAALKSSGVLPVSSGGGSNNVKISELAAARGVGGAAQFQAAIDWLDEQSTHSVLAGFLDLTKTGPGTSGSYALSSDASDFFLQSEEARAREIEHAINEHLYKPLIRYNFGKDAAIPTFHFEPLNAEDQSPAINLLTALAVLPTSAIPSDFIGELAQKVAEYIGMDGDKVLSDFQAAAKKAEAAAAAAGVNAQGQQVAGVAGAVDAASSAVQAAQPGQPPASGDDEAFGTSADGQTLHIPSDVAETIGISQ